MASNAVLDLHRARNPRGGASWRRDSRDPSARGRKAHSNVLTFPDRRSIALQRRKIATLALGLIAIGLIWAGIAAAGVVKGYFGEVQARIESIQFGRYDSREVVVRSGDSLWSIARRYGPAGVDVREVVDWIRKNNELAGATVYPGQVLRVPVAR